jgi:hypothetical protein
MSLASLTLSRALGMTAICVMGSCLFGYNAMAASIDTDADGLDDQLELRLHTNIYAVDTDADGFSDYEEINAGESPLVAGKVKLGSLDTDKDGLPDSWEIRLGTDLKSPDSDRDGFTDGDEVRQGYLPTDSSPIKGAKHIRVSLAKQHLWYSFNGIDLESFPISTGLRSTPTPPGKFDILAKVPVKQYGGAGYDFYFPGTKWNLHFTTGRLGRFYIHGAYWHNNFGRPMSHGCVNVHYRNMERLYNFADLDTDVTITRE